MFFGCIEIVCYIFLVCTNIKRGHPLSLPCLYYKTNYSIASQTKVLDAKHHLQQEEGGVIRWVYTGV